MGIIGLESIIGASEKTANIEGVVLAGVEIGIISYVHRHVHSDMITLDKTFLLKTSVILQGFGMGSIF
jgi:hypothetical protein